MEVGENPSSAATDTPVALNSGEKQQRLKLNFAELFGDDHDEPTPEIKVVATEKRRKNREKERKSANDDPPPANSHGGDDFSSMSDIELKGTIERQTKNLALADKLRDRGEKLKAKLKCLEEELQRRELRHKEVANGFEKPMHSESSSNNGFSDGSMQEAPSSQCSIFATCFLKTLDNPKVEQNTSNQASSAFVREISCLNPCDKSKRKATVKLPQSKRAKPGLSAKEFYAWKPKDQSPRNGVKNRKQAGRVSSFGSLPLLNEKTADTNKKYYRFFESKKGGASTQSFGPATPEIIIIRPKCQKRDGRLITLCAYRFWLMLMLMLMLLFSALVYLIQIDSLVFSCFKYVHLF